MHSNLSSNINKIVYLDIRILTLWWGNIGEFGDSTAFLHNFTCHINVLPFRFSGESSNKL